MILIALCWAYAIGWSITPYFGFGRYIPEGILDSCSFDYLTRDSMVNYNAFRNYEEGKICNKLFGHFRPRHLGCACFSSCIALLCPSSFSATFSSFKQSLSTRKLWGIRLRRWTLLHSALIRMLTPKVRKYVSLKWPSVTLLSGLVCGLPTLPSFLRWIPLFKESKWEIKKKNIIM